MGHRIRPLAERFWPKVERRGDSECWPWRASTRSGGYGQVFIAPGQSMRAAHRVAYELLVGPIGAHLTIDHLCRNRGCCNPAHMEPVTIEENLRRSESPATLNRLKTACPQGHPYDVSNTDRSTANRGGRRCRECRRIRLGGGPTRVRPFVQKTRRSAPLTDAAVREIRRLWDASEANTTELGAMFSITPSLAWMVAKRRVWKHVA